MTDLAPAAPAFAMPAEFLTDMEMEGAFMGLLRRDLGVMPEAVAAALMTVAAAGEISVAENKIEALYDWACNGTDCPDDVRQAAYGAASLFSRFSYGRLGKFDLPGRARRSDGIRAELLRQLGDPGSLVNEADRPEPTGRYVPPPKPKVVTATLAEMAALVGRIETVRDGLRSGSLTKPDAATALDEVHAAAEAMTSDPSAA